MSSDKNARRVLGALYLIVILTTGLSGMMFMSISDSDDIAVFLSAMAEHHNVAYWSVFFGILSSVGIIFLSTYLYSVVKAQHEIIALVGHGMWIGEAIFYAISELGVLGLIALSSRYAATPDNSFYQTFGEFLRNIVYEQSQIILMAFYCAGGLLYYVLFFQSKTIPQWLSALGIAAVMLGIVGVALQLLDVTVPMFVFMPLFVFELLAGLWLLIARNGGTAPAAKELNPAS